MKVPEVLGRARDALQDMDVGGLAEPGIHLQSELYFPVITYPPITMLPPLTEEQLPAGPAWTPAPVAVYLHIPFCRTRCTFCHWVVKTGSRDDEVDAYLDALERDMMLQKARLGVARIPTDAVLVGGGTPSYLSPRQLRRFLESIHRHFDLSRLRQFSFEPEPSTMLGAEGEERIRLLRDFGVQRISMGVQSFDDGELRRTGRNHSAAEALQAIHNLRAGGLESISIDLIYGFADQTPERWARTMRAALESGADAWQLYRLRIVPHGDKPGKIVQEYSVAPARFPEDDDVLLMKMIGIMLSEEHGFPERYTRIFAREDRHISYYLHDVNVRLTDIVGIGVSAWSSVGNVFTLNIGDDLPRYHQRIADGRLPFDRGKVFSAEDMALRSFILPLKNQRLDKASFQARSGQTVEQFRPLLDRLIGLDLLEEDAESIRLTRRGRFFADDVALQFYPPQHRPGRRLEPRVRAS